MVFRSFLSTDSHPTHSQYLALYSLLTSPCQCQPVSVNFDFRLPFLLAKVVLQLNRLAVTIYPDQGVPAIPQYTCSPTWLTSSCQCVHLQHVNFDFSINVGSGLLAVRGAKIDKRSSIS